MAVQAQLGSLVLPPYAAAEEQQMRALKDYGALLMSAAAATPVAHEAYAWQQSELTCNNAGAGAGAGGVAMPAPSRKRRREGDDDELLHYAAFLPLPGIMRPHSAAPAPSTSGRPAEALASELWQSHDALVRAECDRLRAGLEQALVGVGAFVSCLARRAREAEARLEAARRRAAELEERVQLAAAEAQAWCGVTRGNEAVAAVLRATLDALLLRSCSSTGADEVVGESEPGDAESCCWVPDMDAAAAATASSTATAKWACRACGGGEASVLVLPCRHLCLCKACEPRADACPVCFGAKNAALHIAPN